MKTGHCEMISPTAKFTESDVEEAALEWFGELGYAVLDGRTIEPEKPAAERDEFRDVLLSGRLRAAIARLNPHLPATAREDAYRKVALLADPNLVDRNRAFHRLLANGVPVEYRASDGRIIGDTAWLVDFEQVDANDWLVVNQFTVVEKKERRPDIVIFVNGLPLALFELKDMTNPQATIWHAFNQFETYKHDIPALFTYNELLVISDGKEARVGSLTADKDRFMPWRTIDGDDLAPKGSAELQVLIAGLFERRRFLDYLRSFVVFEEDDGTVRKKLAGYHQFHAVQKAIAETVRAADTTGDRRVGVVWHTQGSGKSLTMVFYAGRVILHPAMENPTLVIVTDTNDLDDQLFGTFGRCHELIRQTPQQAGSRDELKEMLRIASGGVIFTTMQKFLPDEKFGQFPLLSDRRNIVVIADEAHRSQYGFVQGYARYLRETLPNASYIGFTGTPIEKADANTRNVFGDYIDVYDVQRAIEDGATVPIYYESRLARLALRESERPKLDADFEEVTEGEEETTRQKLRSKWAALESLVGAEKRLDLIAADLIEHFAERRAVMDGKGMIVCMSRRVCVDLYKALVKLRPEWHSDDDAAGAIKIVMTGSASDPLDWQPHVRNKRGREAIAKRFKKPDDPLQLVIVRDMWLTGFDVPCLHTMYVDKPMRGHGLMQAIARVNRVFHEKPGGLIVDYLGLADQLRQALATYTESGGKGNAAPDQSEAVAIMQEKYEIVAALFHGFDYSTFATGTAAQRVTLVIAALEFILAHVPNGKNRLIRTFADLSKAYALAVARDEALAIRDDVAFFQAVRSGLVKVSAREIQAADDLDHAIRQIVSRAVASNEVIDIFAAAGLDKPDISVLSEEFLAEVRDLPQRNLAAEALQKLLADEIKERGKRNAVQARKFSEMLEKAIQRYQNRAITTAQIIEELIELAKHLREEDARGTKLNLSENEVAFYDALGVSDSAVAVLGDETLRTIAQELVRTVKENVTIDWTVKESVRAKLRLAVKRILRKYKYPPDKQEQAVDSVLDQAALFADAWVQNG